MADKLNDDAGQLLADTEAEAGFLIGPRMRKILLRHVLATLEHVEDEGEKLAEKRREQALEALDKRNKAEDRAERAEGELRHERARSFILDRQFREVRAERDAARYRDDAGAVRRAMDRAKSKHAGGPAADIRIPIHDGREDTFHEASERRRGEADCPEDCEEHETCRSDWAAGEQRADKAIAAAEGDEDLRRDLNLEIQRRRSQEVLAAERLELIEECAAELGKLTEKVRELTEVLDLLDAGREHDRCEDRLAGEKSATAYWKDNAAALNADLKKREDDGQKWEDATVLAIERQKTIVTLRGQRDRAEAKWSDAAQRSITRANEVEALKRELARTTEDAQKGAETAVGLFDNQYEILSRYRAALIRCRDHCEPVDEIVNEALGKKTGSAGGV